MGLNGGIKKLFLIFLFVVNYYGIERVISISKDEEVMMLEKQLNILNKPPIKTIHTVWGDIIDCIDIHKQPAFDHPLLKDHIIQMKPIFPPKLVTRSKAPLMSRASNNTRSSPNVECPKGTVPIRRTSKEDLIRLKSLSAIRTNQFSTNNKFPDQHEATLKLQLKNHTLLYGAKAIINVYNPTIVEDQFSAAQIWIASGPYDQLNNIQAGWIVYPRLYKDNLTRLFGYWTGDGYHKTGCYNMLCPGFVQTHESHYMGEPILATSTEILVLMFQDRATGYWWLKVEDYYVGYWPKSIFTHLGGGGESIYWGGHVKEGSNKISPEMGNGHLPRQHPACYFAQMEYVNELNQLRDLYDLKLQKYVDCKLYDLVDYGFIHFSKFRNTFLFGGPAGKCST